MVRKTRIVNSHSSGPSRMSRLTAPWRRLAILDPMWERTLLILRPFRHPSRQWR